MEGRQRKKGGGSAWGLEMNSKAAGVFAHLFSCFLLTTVGERHSERRDRSWEDGEEETGQ